MNPSEETTASSNSDLLTARRVNEFVYCPRLFWLEEVAGVFVDNEHTEEGRRVHRRVDKPGGTLKPPPLDDDMGESPGPTDYWHSRSLWLSDPQQRLTGRLDFVEQSGESVMPVDTKKGRAAPGPGLWPADEVQLVLQAHLLECAGYQVDQISCWYAAERRRVIVDLDDEMRASALESLEGARRLLSEPTPPKPLIDSPKCPGCSLNLVCLPDETTLLSQLGDSIDSSTTVRRVVPVRDSAMPVYVQAPGGRVGLKGDSLKIVPRKGDSKEMQLVGLNTISHVCVFGTAQVSTQALQALMYREIPVCFFSTGGFFYGRTTHFGNRQVQVRLGQFRALTSDRALHVARVLIADKISNQRTLVRRNRSSLVNDTAIEGVAKALRQLSRRIKAAQAADSPEQLLGYEGDAARNYWTCFSDLVSQDQPEFEMQGRTKRPPRDLTNALLSLGYALLTKDCTLAAAVVGLDPQLGLYHTAHHGRPSMALDLMEPFRALNVDSVVLQLVRRRAIKPGDFVKTGQAISLKQRARKVLIGAYERRLDELVTHPIFGYRISYRQTIAVQARLLTRLLLDEIHEMPSFRTR